MLRTSSWHSADQRRKRTTLEFLFLWFSISLAPCSLFSRFMNNIKNIFSFFSTDSIFVFREFSFLSAGFCSSSFVVAAIVILRNYTCMFVSSTTHKTPKKNWRPSCMSHGMSVYSLFRKKGKNMPARYNIIAREILKLLLFVCLELFTCMCAVLFVPHALTHCQMMSQHYWRGLIFSSVCFFGS